MGLLFWNEWKNAIHYACQGGNTSALRFLLAQFKPGECISLIETADSEGWYPIHICCEHAHVDCIEFLIMDCNANVNAIGPQKLTPLHYAARRGNLLVVELLLSYADTTRQSSDGLTAYEYAKLANHGLVAKAIQAVGKRQFRQKTEVLAQIAALRKKQQQQQQQQAAANK